MVTNFLYQFKWCENGNVHVGKNNRILNLTHKI